MVTYFQVETFYKNGTSVKANFTKFSAARQLYWNTLKSAAKMKVQSVCLWCMQEDEVCLVLLYA